VVGDPHDAKLPAFKPNNLAQLWQLRPKRRARNLDREIAGANESAQFEVLTNCWIRYQCPECSPIPSHGFANFIQYPRKIGSFFVFDVHPVGGVSI